MQRILIIQNIKREGPGLLAPVMAEQQYEFDMLCAGEDALPATLAGYNGLVILGGPPSANEQTDAMIREIAFVQQALTEKMPVLGICLGLQVLVKAAGGAVIRHSEPEIGFHDPTGALYTVTLTNAGRRDPLFAGLPNQIPVFQLHGETVTLTDNMTLLATGAQCRIQAVRVGNHAYGLQCHFELTPEMLDVWLREDDDLQRSDVDNIRQDFLAQQIEYTEIGRRLIRNFLEMI